MSIIIGTAKVEHADNGIVYEIESKDVAFEGVGNQVRQMGLEHAYEGVVHHEELGTLSWSVWEYPAGIENYRSVDVGSHKLIEDFDFDFHESESYELEQKEVQEKRQSRIDILVDWFHERFQDPVHETPYNGREGGYQYLHGGPFDASDELQKNFPDEEYEIIQEAVLEIESDGILDWAPVRGSDEYILDEPDIPPVGNVKSASSKNAFRAEIKELENLIDSLQASQTYPSFEMRDDGLLHFARPSDASQPEEDDPILTELRQAVDDLLKSLAGTNAHTDLLETVERYSNAVYATEISVSVVYAKGIRLDNISSVIKERISQDELPPIPHGTDALLKSVFDFHGNFIMATEEGRTLVENASAFQRTSDETEALSESMRQIAKSIDEIPQLISEEVREEVAASFSEVGSGRHPERSNQIAGSTLGQIGITLLTGIAAFGVNSLVTMAIGESATITSTAVAAGSNIDTAISFLITNASAFQAMTATLAADISWMQPMAEIFQRISDIKISNRNNE